MRSRSGLAGCVAWRLGDTVTYCLDGQVYTVGSAVSWLTEIGLIGGPADLDALGGSVSSPEGVSFVPGLAGLAAPFWKPAARGGFTGLSLASTRAHLVRAVVEGIAAGVAWLAKAVEADLGRPLERLRVDGGLTRSRLLMQIQADLLGIPVEVYSSPNATGLGAAAFRATWERSCHHTRRGNRPMDARNGVRTFRLDRRGALAARKLAKEGRSYGGSQ